MTTAHRRVVFSLLLAAGCAAAQDVELFDQPDFRGVRLTLSAASPDLSAYGLGQRVSSVVVSRGQWEFCTQPQFRGACITVGPGRYARLPAALNDSVASLRPIDDRSRPPEPPRPPRPDTSAPAIVLYAGSFTGAELRLSDAVRDLRSQGYNDTANSIDVLAGTWELCSDGGFGGRCLRFAPGRHELPPELRDRLSSLRPVGPGGPGGPVAPLRPGWTDDHPTGVRPGPDGRPWPGASPAIVFYEHGEGAGRQLPLYGPLSNFNAADFNDIASSVEVLRGRWQVCRHADYGGECIMLGPGRHPLPHRFNDAVSSARPVHARDDRPLGVAPSVTLFDQAELRGRALFVDAPVGNLRDLSFNDRAVAIEVHGGRWELCSSSDYRGRCAVFGPGWHRLPEGLAMELSSLRPR